MIYSIYLQFKLDVKKFKMLTAKEVTGYAGKAMMVDISKANH